MAAAPLATGHVVKMQNVPLVTSMWDADLEAHSGHFWSQQANAWMPFIEMSPQVCAALDARRNHGSPQEVQSRSSGKPRGFSTRSRSSSSSSSSSTSASVKHEPQRRHRRRHRQQPSFSPSRRRRAVKRGSSVGVARSRLGVRAGAATRSTFARGCSMKASGPRGGGSFAARGALRRRRTKKGAAECRK